MCEFVSETFLIFIRFKVDYKKGSIIMGISDDFEYKENYQDEEKVIEVLNDVKGYER